MSSLALQAEHRPKQYPGFPSTPFPGIAQQSHQNYLLKALPPDAWKRISPYLELVELPLGTGLLHEVCALVKYVYFPTNAIVSLQCVMRDGAMTQTAMVGVEGVVGVPLFMGWETSPSRAVVQSAGYAYRMPARILKHEFEHTQPVMRLLLRYTQSLVTQMSQTAVCNSHHSLEQRLCRWLLSSLDRLPGNDIRMTQELISNMIGVRREGVTAAAGKLQQLGMIHYSRGRITVIDREALESHACECYEVVKIESETPLLLS